LSATFDQILQTPWARWINRILSDYPQARERLRPHAGKVARFVSGPFDLALEVTADGAVAVASRLAEPALSVDVPPTLLPRLARRDDSAEREVKFEGDVALAEDIRFLSRHLKWDVEADFSRLFGDSVPGDIVAHRITTTLSDLGGWQKEARNRMGANIREYLTEERPALVPRRDIDTFTREVETLRDDVARLEARLQHLQNSTKQET